MKKTILFLSVAAMLLSACQQRLPQASFDVIPLPKEVNATDGAGFALGPKTRVYFEDGLQREAQFLSEYVNDILHYELPIKTMQGNETDGIVLKLAPADFSQAEAYQIDITPKQVIVKGADAAGVFYGIQTLRKSLPVGGAGGSKILFPCATVRDWPNFGYRGMHLDPCRHFMDLDSVKIYLDMLALHNMNQFHFHLSEDQGWRIEIKKYPELTETGAYRSGTVIGHNGNLYDTIRHGGYYTQEELRDLIQYAAARHINIIPEIDLPGHMQHWHATRSWAARVALTKCGSVGVFQKKCFAQATRKLCGL